MFNEEILTEKLRYLISIDAKKYEIKNFHISFSYDSWENKQSVEEYDVDIEFDYSGSIDPDSDIMFQEISKMCRDLQDIIGKYGINKKGKLNIKGEHTVYPAMIWNINFAVDETHLFNVTYKVTPNE